MATFLASKGVELRSVAGQAGIDLESIEDPDACFDFHAVLLLFEQIAAILNDDAFGLRFAEANPLGPKGLFHFIMANTPTVGDALAARAKYTGLVTNAYRTQYVATATGGIYSWIFPANVGARAQYTDYVVALLVERIRHFLGRRDWYPAQLQIDHKAPAAAEEFERVLGARVQFAAPRTQLVINHATAASALLHADESLLRELERSAQQYLPQGRAVGDLQSRIEAEIISAMPWGGATIDAVAAKTGMSVRSLQSRLQASGLTFRGLTEATRQKAAERLLLDTKTPLTEIAFLLGFSELSAFSRAAKGWFGKAPSQMRKGE